MKLLRLLAVALCVASPALAQVNPGTSPLSIAKGGTSAATAAAARTALGLLIGTNVQAWDADLDAVAALACTGSIVRTASNTVTCRTITGTAAEITVTNGDGVAGVPTLSLPSALTFTGKTITGGTYASVASVNKVAITAPATSATLTLIDGTVVTGPAATGTLMSKTSTDVMTNKTLDSAGTGNVLKVSGVTVSAGQYPGTVTNDNATAGNVGELISVNTPYNAAGATITVTIASPGVVTWTAHGLVNTPIDGNAVIPVFFTTTGALPTGIVANTTYYVIGSSITTNTFQIATTVANAIAGTAINTSGSQSGTHTGFMGLRIGTTSTAVDVTGISLTAGDWEVGAVIQIQPIASATITLVEAYASTVSVTRSSSPAGGTYFFDQQAKTAGTGMSTYIGKRRLKLSGTTTVYLGCFSQFTGTALNITGYLGATRVR